MGANQGVNLWQWSTASKRDSKGVFISCYPQVLCKIFWMTLPYIFCALKNYRTVLDINCAYSQIYSPFFCLLCTKKQSCRQLQILLAAFYLGAPMRDVIRRSEGKRKLDEGFCHSCSFSGYNRLDACLCWELEFLSGDHLHRANFPSFIQAQGLLPLPAVVCTVFFCFLTTPAHDFVNS